MDKTFTTNDQNKEGESVLVMYRYQILFASSLFLIVVVLFVYLFNYTSFFSGLFGGESGSKKEFKAYKVSSVSTNLTQDIENKDEVVHPLKIIFDDRLFEEANSLFNSEEYKLAYDKFEYILNTTDFSSDTKLNETVLLYKFSALTGFNREKGIREYYEFFSDEKRSSINRAYAAIMASQNTIAHNDIQKLLVFLTEEEVRNLPEISKDEVLYLLDKKIFTLYSFPLSATRLALYEIQKLKDKQKIQEMYDKYTFGYENNIQELLSNVGFRHLVPNCLGSMATLNNKMEDLGLVNATLATKNFEDAYKYSTLYSPRTTQHFVLMAFLDHEIKVKNDVNVNKILGIFEYEGNKGETLQTLVKGRFKNEKDFEKFYPYIYKRFKADKKFAEILTQIIKI